MHRIGVNDDSKGTLDADLDERKPLATTTTEELLERTGTCNPYSLFITFSMAFLWMLSAMPTLVTAYTAPPIKCTVNCTFVTVQDEFQLTKSWIDPGEMTSSIYFLGNGMLGQVFCIAADRIGRRPVLVWSLVVSGLAGTLSALAPSFELMLAGRFLQGSFFSVITMVNWVLCGESIAFSGHAFASVLFGCFWVVGYCIITPLAIFLPTWRHVQFVISVPTLLFGFVMMFTLPESVSYSITKKKSKEVEKWVERASFFGGKNINCDVQSTIANETSALQSEDSVLDCLKGALSDRKIVTWVIVQCILWLCDFLIYNGLSLTSTGVGGDNPHLSYLFSGLVELPCYFLMPLSLDVLGRKPTVMLSHIITAAALFAMLFLTSGTPYLIVWLLAKFGMASAFMCCFVYGSEIFPIQYRNICLGLCATVSNFGAMISTHCTILDTIYPGLMFIFFIFLCILCTSLTVLLPETKHNHDREAGDSGTLKTETIRF